MKKYLLLLLPFFLLVLFACPPQRYHLQKEDFLNYTITLKSNEAGYFFSVEAWMFGDQSGFTKFYTPHEWGPATGLDENITAFELTNAVIKKQTKSTLLLEHDPREMIRIKYEVRPSAEYPLKDHNMAYHPILQTNFFQFYGNSLFVYPADLNQKERKVSLTWNGFPDDWVIHNSYGTSQRFQTFRWKDSLWLEAIFIGGDYRVHEIKIKDDPVYVAMRGSEWSFKDEAYLNLLERVISQQRKFWNDYDFNYFTVTLAPYLEKEAGMSYQGTGLRNAFALNATPNVKLQDFEYLFSHELMHEWIGLQIKTADPEAFRFWFSEGFTDYFTYINMRDCGLLDEQGYLDQMNEVIETYYTSPVRTASNEELAENFFSDYNNYGKLAYHRGCLFALYVDWKIRVETAGKSTLKNAMQDFLKTCRSGKQRLTDELFLSTVNKYLKQKIDPQFKKYIQDGNLIIMEDWMLGGKTIVKNEFPKVFDLGFDGDNSTKAKKVTGLKKDSNAYKAGLRNGQEMHGHGYYKGRKDIEAEVYVKIDGAVKKITFFPAGKSKEAIPQFVVK